MKNRYKMNPLSFEKSNTSVDFVQEDGTIDHGYNIHYPDRYIDTVFSNKPNIKLARIIVDGVVTETRENRNFVQNYQDPSSNIKLEDDDLPF